MKKMSFVEVLENRRLLSFTVTGGPTYPDQNLVPLTIANNDTTPSVNDYTDFRYAGVGHDTVSREYTIKAGSTPLNITSIWLSGANSGDFAIASSPTTIAANGQGTIRVTFRPTVAGARTANLVFTTNDASTPKFKAAIAGQGLNTTVLAGGLEVATIAAGTGAGATNGQFLSVTYAGYLYSGFPFDATSYRSNTPFEFQLGMGNVIAGWDQGMLGMKVGEKRVLLIPSALAYGSQAQTNIPANSPLIFETQLKSVLPNPNVTVKGNGQTIADGATTPTTANGTDFAVTSVGVPVTRQFDITSDEFAKTKVFQPSFSGTGASQFSYTGYTVLSNGYRINVTYVATQPGVSDAVMTLGSNDYNHQQYHFALRGTVQTSSPVSLSNGVLSIVGTTGNDRITVSSNGIGLTVTRNGVASVYPVSSVTRIAVQGWAGDDYIEVGSNVAANVLILGGDGNDTLHGGAGNDTIYGGAGNDLIYGHGGNDSLFGETGADTLLGGAGNDTISGGNGADSIDGGAGNNVLNGDGGKDTIRCANGSVDTVDGGAGTDTVYADKNDELTNVETKILS